MSDIFVEAEYVLAELDIMLAAELATLVSTVKAPWLCLSSIKVLVVVVVVARLDLDSWASGLAVIHVPPSASNWKSISPLSIAVSTDIVSSPCNEVVVILTSSFSGTLAGI